jgi:lysophospholipase L1-like esterase
MKFYLAGLLTWLSMEINGQMLAKNEPVKFLALGDSYTIGESVAEDQRWPVQLMNAFAGSGYKCHEPAIIASTGWRTDDLKKAIEGSGISKDHNLVSLLIGVNNQYQGKSSGEYAGEFEELLNIAIQFASDDKSKVFIISIPDYGFTPFGKSRQHEISSEIDAFNAINKSIAEKKGVKYINITDISRQGLKDPELVAGDGLHPSGKMYGLWVERMLGVILGIH